ncbi:MAG TPA: hypothetical protein VM869_28750 [Enhygromyxa sp.]|nr:hypothetical protein [Enhygromyxa sp.]
MKRLSAIVLGLVLAGSASSARAWDPSTTHQALLESAVTRSALHLRWMDASGLERGLFTPLRLDPDRLTPEQLRLLQLAIASAHADSGALPLGGPGACPPASAPPETQLFCVQGDLWEHSALGWIRLGMLAEVTPSARHIHHFLDREQLDAGQWADSELPAVVLRTRQARSNGEPRAGIATGTNFDGKAPTALTWLEDPTDPLAPKATYQHLERASAAPSKAERDHELALALIGIGALLHVTQDLSVPAHARGDASAFFAPLSPAAGDRGLPFQEFVRMEYGRSDLPGIARGIQADPEGVPLAETLIGHLLGEGSYDGLASLAGRRFFSESSVPAPMFLDATLSPSEAATKLLGDDHQLAPEEVEGAVLSPWPSEQGYLLNPSGRALLAFDTDLDGRIRPYLDETCYRDGAAILLPEAARVTTSLLDLLWPAWPLTRRNGDVLTLTIPDWASAELTVMIEDAAGERRIVKQVALPPAADARVELGIAELGELTGGERVLLLLQAERKQGPPIVLEQLLETATTTTSSAAEAEPSTATASGAEPLGPPAAPIDPQPVGY